MTSIYIRRSKIITKEEMENLYTGYNLFEHATDSVNDDLESLFENLRLGKEPDDQWVYTYFLPKLTEEEMELVEQKDTNYLQTFNVLNPDVPEAEMLVSESDSKFLNGVGQRRTFTIENPSENCSDNSSVT